MKNMNSIIRSCLKSVPPFLVAEEDITNFLQFIREKFPDMMITPKLHMLEEHVLSNNGFYGEQRLEGIHSFNTNSTPSPSILTMRRKSTQDYVKPLLTTTSRESSQT